MEAITDCSSGTTGPPKGVVQSHAVVAARLESLHSAWGWSQDDLILSFLPLHHVHGLYNVSQTGKVTKLREENRWF
jgi:malonyl-CoA/methylmalonyl-CoA synthetase